MELDQVEAAVGGRCLVLRADGLAQHLLFDVDRFARELVLADHATLQRVQRVQQTDGERRARAEAAARRKIRVVVDLETASMPR